MIMDCSICPYLMDQTVFHQGEGVLLHRLWFFVLHVTLIIMPGSRGAVEGLVSFLT